MIKYFEYNKVTKQVVGISNGRNLLSGNEITCVELDIKDDELDQILQKECDAFIENGQLVLKLTEMAATKKRKKVINQAIDKVRKGEHTNADLADLLAKFN